MPKTFRQLIISIFTALIFLPLLSYGLEESDEIIKNGLCDINGLLNREQNKYDVQKYFRRTVDNYCLKSTDDNNEAMNVGAMISDSKDRLKISQEQIETIVRNLSCGENNGTGLVFITESLDKANKQASYQVVFFNENTKEIIYSKDVAAKAGGFGFRNYWASTIHKIMKNWKYKK